MGKKTYITEANAAAIVLIVGWILGLVVLDIPKDVSVAIGGLVVAGANIGMRMLHKKGLI